MRGSERRLLGYTVAILMTTLCLVSGCPSGPGTDPNPPNPVPDADGDGVNDTDDLCDNTPPGVTVDDDGCPISSTPDADGDGVADGDDQCADTPIGADVDGDGCGPTQRDTDGDGVNDANDQCENTPTTVNVDADGCPISDPGAPDDDNDGVGDDVDQCLQTPAGATVDANGCAAGERDTDGDGVNDDADQCAGTPAGEAVDADGCAESQLDDDGDGVPNSTDRCANTPQGANVDATGCPATNPPPPPPTANCGNGNVDSGEECDDGNTANGDGCSSRCTIETDNDSCETPSTVTDGLTGFTTVGATTDGPDELGCDFQFADAQIGADIWFTYDATCSGEAVVSLCGSDYDTKLAVYEGSACPTTEPVECSDDDCGPSNFNARVTFAATQGATYLIRIGGFEADTGAGFLTVRCGDDPCGADAGSCEAGNGSPGCDDAQCCQTTCDLDPYCCDVEWDDFCSDESQGLCSGSFDACNALAGSCGVDNGSAGCEDAGCCNAVCMQDPFCCVDTWDGFCAEQALSTCRLACGDSESGSCFQDNGTPGCQDGTCCETVCDQDDECCASGWDQICADLAATLCR